MICTTPGLVSSCLYSEKAGRPRNSWLWLPGVIKDIGLQSCIIRLQEVLDCIVRGGEGNGPLVTIDVKNVEIKIKQTLKNIKNVTRIFKNVCKR